MVQFETHVTQEDDMVDMIAYRRFGHSVAVTEQIYDVNPGLAALGPKLPAGLVIRIPLPAQEDRRLSERLWS